MNETIFKIWLAGFTLVILLVYTFADPKMKDQLNEKPIMVFLALIYAALWFFFVPREIIYSILVVHKKYREGGRDEVG